MNLEAIERFKRATYAANEQHRMADQAQREADFHLGRDLVENFAQHLRRLGFKHAVINQAAYGSRGSGWHFLFHVETSKGQPIQRVADDWFERLNGQTGLHPAEMARALDVWFNTPGRKNHPFFN